jgi:HSP20 family protein
MYISSRSSHTNGEITLQKGVSILPNLERYGKRDYFPSHPLSQIHREINRTFERFFEEPFFAHPMPMMPAINLREEEHQYVIEAEMPGLSEKDLDIEVHGNMLTIKGERKSEEQKQGERMHIVERKYGSFHRSITLPQNANMDHITAEYENGVLTITVPKDRSKEPRKISIKKNS